MSHKKHTKHSLVEFTITLLVLINIALIIILINETNNQKQSEIKTITNQEKNSNLK